MEQIEKMSIRRIYTVKICGREFYFKGRNLLRKSNGSEWIKTEVGKKYRVDFEN